MGGQLRTCHYSYARKDSLRSELRPGHLGPEEETPELTWLYSFSLPTSQDGFRKLTGRGRGMGPFI